MRGGSHVAGGRKPVVVTGLGVASPLGLGRHELWRGLVEARVAVGAFDLFDTSLHRTHVAAQVPGVPSAADLGATHGTARERLSRTDRLALCAALEAVRHADLATDARRPRRVGVFLGTSTGGMWEGEEYFWSLVDPERRALASQLTPHLNNSPGDALARALCLSGPVEVISSACSAATMALEGALDALRSGEVEVALAGGADGLCQLTFAGFNALRAVDERPSRPFRADRAGLSIGEGAGVLVLETLDHARARGAAPIAELAGARSTCDAFHMTAPEPEGRGAAAGMTAAIRDAELDPDDIDFVNLHGTGTPHNDAAEWRALRRVFGERAARLPATSTKGAIGHLLGGCGGVEAVATLLCLDAGLVHPTTGAGPVDPDCPVDLVLGEPRELARCRTAISANLAFGGANSAAVFRRFEEVPR